MIGDAVVVELPEKRHDSLFLMPREKPLPKKKALTKWEAFAKSKGFFTISIIIKGFEMFEFIVNF